MFTCHHKKEEALAVLKLPKGRLPTLLLRRSLRTTDSPPRPPEAAPHIPLSFFAIHPMTCACAFFFLLPLRTSNSRKLMRSTNTSRISSSGHGNWFTASTSSPTSSRPACARRRARLRCCTTSPGPPSDALVNPMPNATDGHGRNSSIRTAPAEGRDTIGGVTLRIQSRHRGHRPCRAKTFPVHSRHRRWPQPNRASQGRHKHTQQSSSSSSSPSCRAIAPGLRRTTRRASVRDGDARSIWGTAV
jgi:hypothetical protein